MAPRNSSEKNSDKQKDINLIDRALRLAAKSEAFLGYATAVKALATEVENLRKIKADLEGTVATVTRHRFFEELNACQRRLNCMEREHLLHLRDCESEELLKMVIERMRERMIRKLQEEIAHMKKSLG